MVFYFPTDNTGLRRDSIKIFFATNARMHCIRALVAINLFLIILYFQKNLRFLNLSIYKSSVVQIIYLNIIVLASSISS